MSSSARAPRATLRLPKRPRPPCTAALRTRMNPDVGRGPQAGFPLVTCPLRDVEPCAAAGASPRPTGMNEPWFNPVGAGSKPAHSPRSFVSVGAHLCYVTLQIFDLVSGTMRQLCVRDVVIIATWRTGPPGRRGRRPPHSRTNHSGTPVGAAPLGGPTPAPRRNWQLLFAETCGIL
jgi:hypothetical protein